MKSFVAAQQEALSTGDADRILNSSSPVAVASLALLENLDRQGQENRKELDALAYAEDFLPDVDTELMLLKMEASLGEAEHMAELKKHILSTNPDDAKLHLALAEILEQGLQFDQAIPEAERAVALDPSSRDAEIALGMGYWGINVYQYNDDTLRAFTAAHQLDPDGYAPNLLLGRIESQYQHYDLAAQYLQAATLADPAAPDPWYRLGMNAYEQSHATEANELLKRYLSVAESAKNKKPAEIRLALVTLDEISKQQGTAPDKDRQAKEAALKEQILRSHGSSNVGSSGQETPPMGSPDTRDQAPRPESSKPAAATAETLAQLRQLAAGALANIGTVFARKQDFARAVVPFRFAAEEDTTLEPLMRNYGLTACISGSYEESAQPLKQVVSDHPDDSAAVGCLGIAEFETGEYSSAAARFTSLGSAISSNPLFEVTAAAAFARMADRARAQQALAAVQNAPADPTLQGREAVAYLDLGDQNRATTLANAALASGKHPAEALRVLGLLDLERGSISQAVAEFQQECNVDPEGSQNQLETEALLAEALMQDAKASEGKDLVAKVTRANPNLAGTLQQHGEMLLKNGDLQAGYESLAAAHALAPDKKEIRTELNSAQRALHIPIR